MVALNKKLTKQLYLKKCCQWQVSLCKDIFEKYTRKTKQKTTLILEQQHFALIHMLKYLVSYKSIQLLTILKKLEGGQEKRKKDN